jgi:hypothetical protein
VLKAREAGVLDAVCAYDQALLEGRDRGARLQRHHVPAAHPAHHPRVVRLDYERLAHLVPELLAVTVFEGDLIPPIEPAQVVEDEVAVRPRRCPWR